MMVSIKVHGVDRTAGIIRWWIRKDDDDVPQLVLTDGQLGTVNYALSDCLISPTRELRHVGMKKPGGKGITPLARVVIYGERYALVYFDKSVVPHVYNMDKLSLVMTLKGSEAFQYFVDVARAREARGKDDSSEHSHVDTNVVRQLNKLPESAESALYAYCRASNQKRTPGHDLIFPFGLNVSQLVAVEQAFSAQVSVIEGPPGTGKTQTILNILANILLRGQTVAVLSNNNAPVANVYEKLEKAGLDYLVAKLGNQKNRHEFFARLPAWPSLPAEPAPTLGQIQAALAQLKQQLGNQNRAAQLTMEIDELKIERRHLQQWQQENGVRADVALSKYGLSPRRTADLMAYLSHLGEQRIGLKERIELLLNFQVLRIKPFIEGDARLSMFHALQMHYYNTSLRDKEFELHACRESLACGNFAALMEWMKAASMLYLKQHLQRESPPKRLFTVASYKEDFDIFLKRFPILGSGTHSLVNSIDPSVMLDYVIIDEASQQDIVPGILSMGCAKNLIVVGDSRQLGHIPVKLGLQAPAEAYDCERYSLLDSCVGVFQKALPRTMLKEHYRCHPRIIQFCNQQFYDNDLVPMTQDGGEESMRLVITAKGNHTRKNANQRELDSLLAVLEDEQAPILIDENGRGFIAPYKEQIGLAENLLPDDFVKQTVHKFQGRECDEIVFSTVLDKKRYNQTSKRQEFVDNPRMINVAVSRAKHRFTLVTGEEVFASSNSDIAALTRYISYYAQDEQVVRAPVVSAFDLLYREFDQSLWRLEASLLSSDSRHKSEQIAVQLLRQTLAAPSYRALMFHTEVKLDQLASPSNPALTAAERAFMVRSKCDLVVYFRVGKVPLGVIEIDGGSHDRADQRERDAKKNSILAKSGLPILRLRTVESHIQERMAAFVAQWASSPASE